MRISKAIATITLVATLGMGTGCATLFKSKTTQVQLDKVPAGTEVIVDGKSAGKAPLSVTLTNKNDHLITFRTPDGKESSCRVESSIALLYVFFNFWTIGWVVDAVTGNWKSIDVSQCASATASASGGSNAGASR